ncbi:MAG: chromosomal replication initiator protein DnaA [Bacilli bacterium]|nr:chromosomal replication initiator protein DnaA [Bacilli bacterium]
MNSISEMAQLWDRTLKRIEEELGEKQLFDSFFAGTYINDIRDNTIVVVTNTALATKIIESKYSDLVKQVINELTESNYELKFIQADEVNKASIVKSVQKKQPYFQDAVLNKNLTFDNFVVGEFNREASQACLLIASKPGKMFNPLFIHSASGLGKTHLLHAIGNYIIKEGNPHAKILYTTAHLLVDEYVKYVRVDSDNQSLTDFFKDVDVLLLDDVQFLADKVKTQELFFTIYNNMINSGKQIVITSDRHPNDLNKLEDRLVTRFNQGLVVNIKEPDQNTCVEILRKKIEANDLDPNNFDENVLYFFADKFSKNVRELEGALNRLIFYTINIKQTSRITLDTAAEAVQSLVGGKERFAQLNEQKIINIVADYYNLTSSQLTGKIRTGQIALARHIAMYLIRINLDVSLKKIGDMFGGKDHTTVMSAITKVDKELKTDENLKAAITELQKRLK